MAKRFWLSAIFCGVFLSTQACAEIPWETHNAAGQEAYEQARYAEAEKAWLLALKEAEKFGQQDFRLATSLNNLATVYQAQWKFQEAETLLMRALAIDEKTLGPEHPATVISLSNLAVLYRYQGKYAEAEPLLKRALAIREKPLGPEHPDVATSIINLANLYRDQGKYAEAEALYQRALEILEKALGPEHLDVAGSLASQALLYSDQGKYAEAEPLLKRALAIMEKALGPEHPTVAPVLESYAYLLRKMGRDDEAVQMEARAKTSRGKSRWETNTAAGYEAYEQGDYAEAEKAWSAALQEAEKFGPEDPRLAESLGNLGVAYRDQGKYAEAEPLFKRSLSITEKALGQCCPGKVAPSDGKSRPFNVLWPVLPGNDLKSRGRKWSPERSIRTRHNEG